jgi:lipoyl(octanoyl) transferase
MLNLLPWTYLGIRPYREIWELQEATREKIQRTGKGATLFIVQHPPTISLGRGENGINVLFPEAELQQRGFDVVATN